MNLLKFEIKRLFWNILENNKPYYVHVIWNKKEQLFEITCHKTVMKNLVYLS